jgi:hypothetical protein
LSWVNGCGLSIREAVFTGPRAPQPRRTQYASNDANVLSSISVIHLHAPA